VSPSAKPGISVVIPTFNRAGMVTEAVESVLNQTCRDFELIVVDDGSTDGTFDILAAMDGPIQVLRRENGGVSAARNTGIAAARGELLAFLDSDDIWLPEKLAVQAGFMSVFPAATLCHTEEIWLRNGKRVNPRKHHAKARGPEFRRLLRDCLISPSSVMIRRSVLLEAGGFDENLPACEDYDLWLRLARDHDIHLIDRPLVVKRGGHDDQLSRTIPALDRYRVRALEKLLDRGLSDEDAMEVREVLAEKCLIIAGGSDRRGRADEARRFRDLAAGYSS
jgi:glycosyltransferase involved in cell wall biosynthesis